MSFKFLDKLSNTCDTTNKMVLCLVIIPNRRKPGSLSEMVCPHEKYWSKIRDYIFFQMKAIKIFRSQGCNFFISMCLFQNAMV